MKDNRHIFIIKLISCTGLISYLIFDLLVYKNTVNDFHKWVLGAIIIIVISSNFEYINIPGFAEFKKDISKKVDGLSQKLNQLQIFSISLNNQNNPISGENTAPSDWKTKDATTETEAGNTN